MIRHGIVLLGLLAVVASTGSGQETPAPNPAAPVQSSPPPKARGQVLFSTERPPDGAEPQTSSSAGNVPEGPEDVLPKPAVTDEERAAVQITGYDLDVHLVPADAREQVQAVLSVRNQTGSPLSRIPLQISSTLRVQAVSSVVDGRAQRVPYTESPVATDADHTGYAEEAVIVPSVPLPAGGTLVLNVLYGGTIAPSSARLDLLGASPEKAAVTDWDRIAPTSDASATALRGFGNVLWYPVASPLALLGDGNKLFALAGAQRLANQDASMRLRLTVEYAGDPPEGVIFDGALQALSKVPDGQDQVIAESTGIATAEFARRPLGFRMPSLFLTAQKPMLSEGAALQTITPNPDAAIPYAEAAGRVQALESDWFGVTPLRPLTLLDHPGQPFQDGPLLVGQLAADAEVDAVARLLVRPMTAAWLRSEHPWIADGIAEFLGLLWTEREAGRNAAQAQLEAEDRTLALAEPGTGQGQPLTATGSELFYRVKAAAVWWQLRDLLGEDALRQGLQAYRHSESLNSAFDADPKSMQKTLERVSGKELGWFFVDWVYRDMGLPDLSIVQVNTRALPAKAGKESGYLVAVEVRNGGNAVAEVPVTVSSGDLTATERLRIAGGSVASVRIIFQGMPERVQVNDGSTPEIGQAEHTFLVKTLQ